MKPITLELAPVQPGEPPMKQVAVWDDFQAKAEKLKATMAGAEKIKLLCIVEAFDESSGELILRSPASIKGIKLGDNAIVEINRYL